MKNSSKNTRILSGQSSDGEIVKIGEFTKNSDVDFLDDAQEPAEEKLMERLKAKEAEGHELCEVLGMVPITHEATEAMILITEKNRVIEEVKAEAEAAKKEVNDLKTDKSKISRNDAKAKAARMWEADKALEKVEEVAKQINDFELGREGESIIFELTNKSGQKFKTSNAYLTEAVLATLKKEITKKAIELEQTLKYLY